jgi:hypothetical protein
MTQDSTNGDRLNVKVGADEVATASINLTIYGSPTEQAPFILQGYTSAAADLGVAGIDGNNGAYDVLGFGGISYVHVLDIHLHNSQQRGLTAAHYCTAARLEVNDVGDGAYDGINLGSSACVTRCNVHDVNDRGIDIASGIVYGNYLKNDGTRDMLCAIRCTGIGVVLNNIISIDGATDGIDVRQGGVAIGNSILSSSGTGSGITLGATNSTIASITNNIVEGFSGVGGVGIDPSASGTVLQLYGSNAAYNNTTNYASVGSHVINNTGDNESLSESGFTKSGADTFANRFTYFAPVDTGNVQTGGFPQA